MVNPVLLCPSKVLEKFPTDDEIINKNAAKTYKANLWVRKDETIVLKTKFGKSFKKW